MDDAGSRLVRTMLLVLSTLLPAAFAVGQRVTWQLHVTGLH